MGNDLRPSYRTFAQAARVSDLDTQLMALVTVISARGSSFVAIYPGTVMSWDDSAILADI
jgi:hypothetical protein